MDFWFWFWIIIIGLIWFLGGLGIGFLWGRSLGHKEHHAHHLVNKRISEPLTDAQRATREPFQDPKHRARVTTAHMSQPRSQWNRNSEES